MTSLGCTERRRYDVATMSCCQVGSDQTGVYTYNAAQVISNYWESLCKNVFTISDTQKFSLEEDEEDDSYDIESLFTNIQVRKQ